jgi:Glyoxalase-like domain
MANRLGGIMIDCSEDVFEDGVRFWGAALGVEPERRNDPTSPYVGLPGAHDGVGIEVQRVGGASRFHLDLEAEDVDEEAARLESLGATKIERVESWWVMQAPTGHLFCVVPTE